MADDTATSFNEMMDRATKATVSPYDIIDGMIYAMAAAGREYFPYAFTDRRMVRAFQRLFEDIDELFSPFGSKNDCGIICINAVHGTSETVEKMLNVAILQARLMNFDGNGPHMRIIRTAAEGREALSERRKSFPGNAAVYEELVKRFCRYYDEIPE